MSAIVVNMLDDVRVWLSKYGCSNYKYTVGTFKRYNNNLRDSVSNHGIGIQSANDLVLSTEKYLLFIKYLKCTH